VYGDFELNVSWYVTLDFHLLEAFFIANLDTCKTFISLLTMYSTYVIYLLFPCKRNEHWKLRLKNSMFLTYAKFESGEEENKQRRGKIA
jgi:hypothetical protein